MDAGQVRVFNGPSVGIVAAVQNGGDLALGNALRVVIAAIDAAVLLLQRQIELVLAEFGAGHHFLEDAQDGIGRFPSRPEKLTLALVSPMLDSTEAAMFSSSSSI